MSGDKRMIKTVWTEEVVDYITMQRNSKNAKWSQIVRRLQQHFNITTTVKNAMNQYHKRKKEMDGLIEEKGSENMNWKNEPATRKQCSYIAGLTLPNGSKKLKKTLEDQLYDKSFTGEFTKDMASERIQSLELQVNAVKSSIKGMKNIPWTESENNAILSCHSAMSAVALKLPNRTESAVKQRYYSLRKKAKANTEIVAKKRPNTKLHKKKTESQWTKEEDFDLLCNFYELSIVEAKKRYNRNYGTIASRLESLFESTKPENMLLLMEASAFTKARKAEEIESYKNGYFKRRKATKMAKKRLKKERKAAKLEAKLNKLRGE